MKVLFINPVIRENDKPRYAPYGMAQLVAIAIKKGYKVQVFDANAIRPNLKLVKKVIVIDNWDVIVIGGLVTSYGYIKKLSMIIKQLKPNLPIIAGGGFITPIPYEIMKFIPEIDVGIIGEGYVTLLEVLERFKNKELIFEDIKGIIFRNKNKELILTSKRELLPENELDSLPFPAFDLFPMEIYFKNSGILLSEEMMTSKANIGIIASYGCPFKCKYCFHLGLSDELNIKSKNKKNYIELTKSRRVRVHSPEYVIEMIKYFKRKFQIDFISFLDENFAILYKREKWFTAFFDLWMKEGFQPLCIKKKEKHSEKCNGIHWSTTAHAKIVNENMLIDFKEMGCASLDFGFESFDRNILESIGKESTPELNEKALIMTLKAGIRPIPNQMIGFPNDTIESIKTTVRYWIKLGIKSKPFFATPYPGCEWYYTYYEKIMEQYNNNLENFLLDLGDAINPTVVLSKHLNLVELLGLRELMVRYDLKKIEVYEQFKKNLESW